MKKVFIVIFLFLTLLLAYYKYQLSIDVPQIDKNNQTMKKEAKPIPESKKEKYDIIGALLNNNKVFFLKNRTSFVIASQSVDLREVIESDTGKNAKEYLESVINKWKKDENIHISKEVVKNLLDNNKEFSKLKNKFLNYKVSIAPETEPDAIFREIEWELSQNESRESKKYFRFSEPGFNNNCTESLIYYEMFSRTSGSGGGLVYLEKKDNSWVVVFADVLWGT